MRVKYPINNLDNRIEVVANSLPSLINLPCIGYALIHGDFTKCYFGVLGVWAYPDYIISTKEENVNRQKKYIITGLDFALEYLSDDWIDELIVRLRFRNTESELGRWKTKVKEIIFGYIADNKNEFSEIYLELMLG